MAQSGAAVSVNSPRIVQIARKKHSFGFKVRGQVNIGGPRWLIDGKEYKNLQTVSEVIPDSAAEDGGILPGDRVLSVNGTEVEGIEHEKFKELIRDSTDDLELVVITPIDAKMLDIPAGLVIHKSDGSKLSIDHSALLSSNNIEKVIQNRVKMLKEAEIDNLNSSSTAADIDVEEESANREEKDYSKEDNNDGQKEVEEKKESKTDEHLDVDICETEEKCNEKAESYSSNGEKEDSGQPEDYAEKLDSDLTENEIEESSMELEGMSDSGSNIDNPLVVIDIDQVSDSGSNIDNPLVVIDIDQVSDSGSSIDNPLVLIDIEEFQETAFMDNEIEMAEQASFTCEDSCQKNDAKKEDGFKEGRKKKQKRMLPKRPKLRPFSPDTFNSLSPYCSKPQLKFSKTTEKPPCSWRYDQRPTSFSVLHPADALRLDGTDLHDQSIIAWSSNLAKKQTVKKELAEGETPRFRDDVVTMQQAIETRMIGSNNRSTHRKKMGSLNRHFTSAHAQNTFQTYLGVSP